MRKKIIFPNLNEEETEKKGAASLSSSPSLSSSLSNRLFLVPFLSPSTGHGEKEKDKTV